jgi:outer membrane protein OmpA-like peptidoglycan-associated protein
MVLAATILAAGCAKHRQASIPPPAPPPAPAPAAAPARNVFAMLPDPGGRITSIVISNPGGTQEIGQPNQAVRVQRADTAPTAPFPVDQSMMRSMFGAALDALPEPEVHFVLYFDEASDTLNAASTAMIPEILRAVQERHSTDISVTGHTDRSGTTAGNYQLGLRRAATVASVLRPQGVGADDVFVTSHGESDPLVKTDPGAVEPRNRRVEVIVH